MGQPWPRSSEDYAHIADYQDVVSAELDRWSRNLLAMASLDREIDEGFAEYIAMLDKLVDVYQSPNPPGDGSTRYLKFPLRP
jgi:hypothetical protein